MLEWFFHFGKLKSCHDFGVTIYLPLIQRKLILKIIFYYTKQSCVGLGRFHFEK